jgi:hypothetical protein
VKRCGARVLTLDQLEGLKDPTVECWGENEDDNDGDPPRLWAPNATYVYKIVVHVRIHS